MSHPLYSIWAGIKQRCYNPRTKSYRWYGARGIKVCARWRKSFEAFASDMGPRPSLKHSVDRKDNDGNYEPGNCRWATEGEQIENRRIKPRFLIKLIGVRLKTAEYMRFERLAKHFGVSVPELCRRMLDRHLEEEEGKKR